MKKIMIKLFALIIGSCGLCLLAFSRRYATGSVFEFATLAVVNVAFIIYGLGGNAALSKLPLVKMLSMPMTKKHFKDVVNSPGRGSE